LSPRTKAGDIILAVAAGTDSNMNRMRFNGWDFPASADFDMLSTAAVISKTPEYLAQLKQTNSKVHIGNVFTSDYFYHPQDDVQMPMLTKHNILGVEMEAAGLYGMAHEHGVQALAMMTITDEIHLKDYNW